MNSFSYTPTSQNRKTGPIGVITISRNSCPSACAFYNKGCYAELGYTRFTWNRTDKKGLNIQEVLEKIAKNPPPLRIIRYAVAGDLIGEGNSIDGQATKSFFAQITEKNHVFTYTHKPVIEGQKTVHRNEVSKKIIKNNIEAIKALNAIDKLTVNLSSNNLAHADELVDLGIGPVVTVLPSDYKEKTALTPKGRKVVVCPAQTMENVTCASCKLCTKKNRSCIVGFLSHGSQKTQVDKIIAK